MSPLRLARAGRAPAIVAAALALGGCVTESIEPVRPAGTRRQGVTLETRPGSGTPARPAAAPAGGSAAIDSEAVRDAVRPADPASTVVARAVVGVEPLGVVLYDGLTLPIVSPDGRYAAVQVGTPPGFDVLLGKSAADPTDRLRVSAFELASGRPVELAPDGRGLGLILGRGATNEGVLVEEPLPDGSRRVGLLPWREGAVRWLESPPPGVRAFHAAPAPQGGLVFVRASADPGEAEELVLRVGRADLPGQVWTFKGRPGDRLLYPQAAEWAPIAPDDVGLGVLALRLSRQAGLELLLLTPESPSERGRLRVAAAWVLDGRGSERSAFQASASVQAGELGVGPGGSADGRSLLLVFHPVQGRMIAVDPAGRRLAWLPTGSFAAACGWDPGAEGDPLDRPFLSATGDGLVYARPESSATGPGRGPARMARVLNRPYVPRATTSADRPYVLLGPGGGDGPPRLELLGLRPAASE